MSTGPASAGQASTGPASAESGSTGAWPQPMGKPPAAHWWSIQKPPPGEPISARRAYGEVLGVFAIFFSVGIVAGAETLVRRYPPPSGSWAVFVPATISELATTSLAVLVTVLLSARRGITARSLGFGLPRKVDGREAGWAAFRVGVWAVIALVVGGVITGYLATGKLGQPVRQDASYLIYTTAASLAAGIVEETVVLIFVVTTLRQARRPLLEIVLVAVLLRCSYHDYYGPGVIGIAVWAAMFAWLFLRSGSVIPLIVAHFLWDATIFWSQRWHWIDTARGLGALAAVIVATVSWLAERSKRNRGGRRPGGRSAATYAAWPYAEQPSAGGDPGQRRR